MKPYAEYERKYAKQYKDLDSIHRRISYCRLGACVGSLLLFYNYFQTKSEISLALAILLGVAFLLLIKKHVDISLQRKIAANLITVVKDEIQYVEGKAIPYPNGAEHMDYEHLYSYDLDVFGPHSLFHHLNRTATFSGNRRLAQLLKSRLDYKQIIPNQVAIQELINKVGWRHHILAIARFAKADEAAYSKLMKWVELEVRNKSTIVTISLYLMPSLVAALLLSYLFVQNMTLLRVFLFVFSLNITIVLSQLKKIKQETLASSQITPIIEKHSLILEKIESENFTSKKLVDLQVLLKGNQGNVSHQIKKLNSLFSSIDSIQNLLAAAILNGFFLYHLHQLYRLQKWKQKYGKNIEQWLQVMGEFEALNSLANLVYNNPSYCFPKINDAQVINMVEMGHPLIAHQERVNNNISFDTHRLTILTGSNMSGKSTFLRALGVNMILAGIGSAICAQEANLHPIPILVSMRQKDSLADGESYFFAEVKRLKQIIDALQHETSLVLLDEILKGTNSEDKYTGTQEVISKLVTAKAIGVIATHDLKLCHMPSDYPMYIVNMCFESQIVNNELYFDYKLQQGICQNKSATFLMQKLKII